MGCKWRGCQEAAQPITRHLRDPNGLVLCFCSSGGTFQIKLPSRMMSGLVLQCMLYTMYHCILAHRRLCLQHFSFMQRHRCQFLLEHRHCLFQFNVLCKFLFAKTMSASEGSQSFELSRLQAVVGGQQIAMPPQPARCSQTVSCRVSSCLPNWNKPLAHNMQWQAYLVSIFQIQETTFVECPSGPWCAVCKFKLSS